MFPAGADPTRDARDPWAEIATSKRDGRPVVTETVVLARGEEWRIPTYVDEFWTARQRAANRLHEISYRACFKPQLPRYFLDRLSRPGDRVHDPFMGRGTTVLEAALADRRPSGADVNPLSRILVEPRLAPPFLEEVAARLAELPLETPSDPPPEDLLVFYHPRTLAEIAGLREWLLRRERAGELDDVDRWIRMVAVNRLTGHSPGFFSVYTMPPNQAVSIEAQRKINARRNQRPPRRDVRALILRKSRSLLSQLDDDLRGRLARARREARLFTASAEATSELESGSVALVVTSPPFLDVVQYAADNWLRCWFCGIDAERVPITMARTLGAWRERMTAALAEQRRLLRPGGHVAFEVGEVRKGTVLLEREVIPCALRAGLEPVAVLIHDQEFTKTANCWGIANNRRGTNTNRIVVLRRP